MASFNGSEGSVTIETAASAGDTILLHTSAWSFDWTREPNDVTEFDSAPGWKDTLPGLCKITGALEGFYQDAGEDALVASRIIAKNIHLVESANASRSFTFTDGVNLTNLSFQTEIGTANRWSASFSASVKPTIA